MKDVLSECVLLMGMQLWSRTIASDSRKMEGTVLPSPRVRLRAMLTVCVENARHSFLMDKI